MRKGFIVACLLLATLPAACSARTLAGHVFDIPKANVVSDGDAPSFLPTLDPGDGFSFYLNPEASLPDQILVAVASRERMCSRAAGTQARVNATVCAARPFSWRGRPLRKAEDGAFWTYDLPVEARAEKAASLIGCFAMSDGSKAGLCTATLPYGDLVLTIHLRDDRVASLQALYDEAVADLRRWER